MKRPNRHSAGSILRAALIAAMPAVAAFGAGDLAAQDANAEVEPRSLVDVPTAGMLRAGMKSFRADFYHSDGVDAGFAYGIADRVMVGVSYGGARMIGTRAPDWNEVPGFLLRIRVVEESEGFPAMAIGFESQGADGYVDALDRFVVKSPGAYFVISKNYDASGYLGFHGGVNYSFEKDDGDKDVNLFAGLDKSFGSFLVLTGEYNVGWNDNSGNALGRGRGYLNAGLSIFPGAGIAISVHFKDLLENQPHEGFASRTLRVELAR